jgi:amidohydrolase
MGYIEDAQALFSYAKTLRRDFHAHPELGFQEIRTAGIVASELRALGLEVSTGVGKTGVVTLIEGASSGPVGLLRFDMDALPIQEATNADYASQVPGVMHACGHDGHTAIGLTVARLLLNHRDHLKGTIKLVFQPAEEGLGGAEAMIRDGVLENPRPDFCLGLHLWNEKTLGWLSATPGPVMAASETFKVLITGKGGHGASPHLTNDPVMASAQIISSLQSIVARNVNPLQSAVVSVTVVKAGEAHNVIPQQAELQGTIRSFDPAVRNLVLERFQQIVTGVAQAIGCSAEIQLRSITPAVINDPIIAQAVQSVIQKLLPEDELDIHTQTMGSEDMAFFQVSIPGCYFFVGSNNRDRGLDAPHHHPRFDFDEAALSKAAALMTAATIKCSDLFMMVNN